MKKYLAVFAISILAISSVSNAQNDNTKPKHSSKFQTSCTKPTKPNFGDCKVIADKCEKAKCAAKVRVARAEYGVETSKFRICRANEMQIKANERLEKAKKKSSEVESGKACGVKTSRSAKASKAEKTAPAGIEPAKAQ